MAQESKKLKQCGKKLFEPADFQRLFKYLPLNVLRKYTNIEKLIIDEYEKKHDKPPPGIYVNKTIKKYHKIMKSKYDWKEPIDQLDFRWPKKDKTYVIRLLHLDFLYVWLICLIFMQTRINLVHIKERPR